MVFCTTKAEQEVSETGKLPYFARLLSYGWLSREPLAHFRHRPFLPFQAEGQLLPELPYLSTIFVLLSLAFSVLQHLSKTAQKILSVSSVSVLLTDPDGYTQSTPAGSKYDA